MVDSVSDESLRVVAVGLVAMAAIALGAAAVSAGVDGVPSSPSDDPEVDTGTPIGDGGLQPDGPEEVLVRVSGD